MSDQTPETPDEDRPDSSGNTPPPPEPGVPDGPPGGPPPSGPPPAGPPSYGPPPSGPPPAGPPSYGPPPSGPPPYGPPGYGPQQPPPGYYQVPPGHDPWQAYGAPGYGAPGHQLPPGYYAGPQDPLVSADFGGWWQRSFTLLAAVWRPMTQVQLVWAIPLVVVGILAALYAPEQTVTFDGATTPDLGEALQPLLLIIPFALAAVLLSLVAALATLEVLVQHATGRPTAVGAALVTGLRRFLPLFGWQFLAGLVILVGLVLCFLPGIYAGIVFLILPVIILLERGQGVGRAFQLVHADFGPAIARLATIVGLHIAFALVEGIISAILTSPATGALTALGVLSAVLSAVFAVVTGVVISPLLLTAYADMRARREPFSTAYLVNRPDPR